MKLALVCLFAAVALVGVGACSAPTLSGVSAQPVAASSSSPPSSTPTLITLPPSAVEMTFTQNENQFLQYLKDQKHPFANQPADEVLDYGYTICGMISQGRDPVDVITFVDGNSEYQNVKDAALLVTAAQVYLCTGGDGI